jgi:antitoxin ParD1/3/4
MNISMPAAMRQYIEAKAAEGNYTASEYVRHLIREDQRRQDAEIDAFITKNKKEINQLLEISAKEFDQGLGVELDIDAFLEDLRSSRSKRKKRK